MPNLDNLRKQAKQIVRWHHERVWTVATIIREQLPRFRDFSDRDIMDADFKLADAQELVARRAGFESWEALLAAPGCAADTERDDLGSSRLIAAIPFIFVRDIRAACAWYERTLGFGVAFTYGEPPFYAEIVRDDVRFALRCTDAAVIDPQLARREELLSTNIAVDEIKSLYLAFQRDGAKFFRPLRTEPYGVRDFIVEDPDGNLLCFHGSASVGVS